MSNNLDVKLVGVTSMNFRKVNLKGKPVEIIEVTLLDGDGREFRHSLWLDGNKGPDASAEQVMQSLQAYGWDGKELGSLTTSDGLAKHIKFPDAGVDVVYRAKEYRDGNGRMQEYNEVRWIPSLGGGSLSKSEVSSIEKKLGRVSGNKSNTSLGASPSVSGPDEDVFV